MRYKLITPYWEAPEPRRNEELRYCERVNRERFDTVLMPKGRPTYRDLFTLCDDDCINVVANSDIYFDDSIRLCDKMQPNDCYASDPDTIGVNYGAGPGGLKMFGYLRDL